LSSIRRIPRKAQSANENQFLAMLPAETYNSIKGSLELVEMPLGCSLCEPNVEITHVYFPVDCTISLLGLTEDGDAAEIAVIGYEGVIGVARFWGGGSMPMGAVVQSSGQAYRLPGHVAEEEFHRGGLMQRLLLRYSQALLNQVALTAACNANHSLDQQLCRWLLLSHDRLRTGQLMKPSAQLGNTRGVWHEVVREAISKLQTQGLIEYHRGHIAITDRAALEARSCGCYDVVRGEYDRLLQVQTAD
jgi:CRP-like cAMP-binding protein